MISKNQLAAITTNALGVKMMLTYPKHLFDICGNSAWLAMIYSTLLAAVFFGAIRLAYSAKVSVIGAAYKAGGRQLRTVTGLLVFGILLLNIFPYMREFPEIIRLVLLQGTYAEYISLAFLVTVVLCAYCGIEALARIHEIFVPIAGVMFILFVVLLCPSFEAENLMPVFGSGIYSILIKGLSGLSVFTDLLLLNLLIPRARSLGDYSASGNIAIVSGGLFGVIILLLYGMCYVYPASTEFFIPLYQLERLIHLSNFFSRFEAIFQFVWTICILLYCSLYIAVMADTWKETFGLRYGRPLIMPITALIFAASIIPESFEKIAEAEAEIGNWIYIPAFAVPLIVGLIYHMKGVRN